MVSNCNVSVVGLMLSSNYARILSGESLCLSDLFWIFLTILSIKYQSTLNFCLLSECRNAWASLFCSIFSAFCIMIGLLPKVFCSPQSSKVIDVIRSSLYMTSNFVFETPFLKTLVSPSKGLRPSESLIGCPVIVLLRGSLV